MLSIQDVGKEILSGSPRKFYALLGEGWGVKSRYLDILRQHYKSCFEYPQVSEVLELFRVKRLVPNPPSLYIVRYDELFLSELNDSKAAELLKLKISGTVVCIYDSSKAYTKFEKFLPNNSVVITTVSPQFVKRYLHSDFPNLADNFIDLAVSISADYGEAKNMCRAMAVVDPGKLVRHTKVELSNIFGYSNQFSDDQIKQAIAARDFNFLCKVAYACSDDPDKVLYNILYTMIELEKLVCNPRSQSDLRPYMKQWNIFDIYNMYVNTYEEIRKLRSMSSYNPQNSLVYLFGLLRYSPVPSVEDMS